MPARAGRESGILPAMTLQLLPPLLRLAFPEPHRTFEFVPPAPAMPSAPDGPLHLYVHLPFCRRICAFCPYVKRVYDADTVTAYEQALLRELERYRQSWDGFGVASVYFGGGTPSLTPEIIERVLSWLRSNGSPGGEVGVEVHPHDATTALLRRLHDCGVTMVSLGVQTFNERMLAALDRGYDARTAEAACRRALEERFETVDIDLIFALPGQTLGEAVHDIAAAAALGAGQISAYPLIHFSDTPLATLLKSQGVSLPTRRTEERMLAALVQQARSTGYERSSIWSFNRPGAPRYTTVTRDSFLGIGAGASSRLGDRFQVNTFSVGQYIEATRSGIPAALGTRMNEGDRMAYWLFWRCYDTVVDTARFREVFGQDMPASVRASLSALRALGLVRREGPAYQLTDRGAYLFHLIEKEYTHSYLEKLWSACRREAWPQRVSL